MLNIKQNTEENRPIGDLNLNVSTISNIHLNKHALRNLSKHWSSEIGKLKESNQYPKRERSMSRPGN